MVISRNPPYPIDWPAPAVERIDACPIIAGRYANLGEMHPKSGASCRWTDSDRLPEKGSWNSSLLLTDNLEVGIVRRHDCAVTA